MSYPQAGGRVVKFVPASDRDAQRKLKAALAVIDGLPDSVLPPDVRERIAEQAAPHVPVPPSDASKLGVFVMISREETGLVWQMIRDLKPHERPHDVRAVFDQVLLKMEFHTGVIDASREDIAEATGLALTSVSRAMRVLERWKVIKSALEKQQGVRGRGRVRWRINSRVAWIGDREERARAAAEDGPLLVLMQGGKREHHAARDPAPAL